jgi:hypothetical protein
MAVGAALPSPETAAPVPGGVRRYTLFGLRVACDVALPIPPLEGPPADGVPDAWTIRRRDPGATPPEPDGPLVYEERCDGPCHVGRAFSRLHRGPGGAWFWDDRAGTCHVSADARRVDVYATRGADEGALGLMLLGPVAGFVLHRLGYPCLHASAVVLGGGAVAFLAPPGGGKSTLAAAFLRRGATLLSDDVLPLLVGPAGVRAAPGVPVMKVWEATARCTLGLSEVLPNLSATLEKKRLGVAGRFPFAPGPVPLRALYVLERVPAGGPGGPEGPEGPEGATAPGPQAIEVVPLGGREALAALLSQTYRGEMLLPPEAARLLPLYAGLKTLVPLRRLRFPSGFELQDAVGDAVLADLERPEREAGR